MTKPSQPATIIGGPASPFVRKVLAVCEMKGVPYRLDPIVPFFGNDAFGDISPLRRIPVFIDDQVSLCDSTVCCRNAAPRWKAARRPITAMMAQAAIRGSCCRYGATAASACCWSPMPSRKRRRGTAALRH